MPDSMPTAVLFPGQGSQTPEMRDDVERVRPELIALATEIVGGDPFARVSEGTRFAQPAILCASLAGWERLARAGEDGADVLAGHSLGEFGALVAAGALAEEDAVALVALRGRLMDEAAAQTGDGAMLAVLGDGANHARAVALVHDLTVANDNAPTQVVLSGAVDAIDAAASDLERVGLKAMRLAVAGAFHSPAMRSAVEPFRAALEATAFRAPRTPVLSSITAAPFSDVRAELLAGLTEGVRWRETLLALRRRGIERFVDAGPGRVLATLVKRSLDGATAMTVASLDAKAAGV